MSDTADVKRGQLLALEGLDGSGKSTLASRVVDALRKRGHDVVATREPTDGSHGQRIRAMATSTERIDPEEELRWFMEDRREHVRDVINPALAAGQLVVTDRYFLSTVAYQGARGLDWERILAECEQEFPLPDLALILRIPPDLGLGRAHNRPGRAEPAFEEREFLTRVAAIYAVLQRPYIERTDATGNPDQVAVDTMRIAVSKLGV